jgi:hypothetical protein
MNRRDWLGLAARSVFGAPVGLAVGSQQSTAKSQTGLSPTAEAELKAVQERLFQAKIGPLSTVRSTYFRAIGDASEWFMSVVLKDYEQITSDYVRHFRAKGFQLRLHHAPLTVVVCSDDRSYRKFFGLPPSSPAWMPQPPDGAYDKQMNVLVVFDWRSRRAPHSGHNNMLVLVHEGTHQLSFNTGLLSREGDAPLCIVEGLGTYGEARELIGPSEFGRRNLGRMAQLKQSQQLGWIPMRELFADDTVFRTGWKVLLAYAESWLLVHYLLNNENVLPRFREYLKDIQARRTAEQRIDCAQKHLGDLNVLDTSLKRYAVSLERGR